MSRPMPPASLLGLSELSGFDIRLTPASKVWDWLQAEILADTGSIHNDLSVGQASTQNIGTGSGNGDLIIRNPDCRGVTGTL